MGNRGWLLGTKFTRIAVAFDPKWVFFLGSHSNPPANQFSRGWFYYPKWPHIVAQNASGVHQCRLGVFFLSPILFSREYRGKKSPSKFLVHSEFSHTQANQIALTRISMALFTTFHPLLLIYCTINHLLGCQWIPLHYFDLWFMWISTGFFTETFSRTNKKNDNQSAAIFTHTLSLQHCEVGWRWFDVL